MDGIKLADAAFSYVFVTLRRYSKKRCSAQVPIKMRTDNAKNKVAQQKMSILYLSEEYIENSIIIPLQANIF